MRVLAALSGGVDSAVAAARLRDAGHDVTCVHLALSRTPATHRDGARGCCSLEDSRDAARVADLLGLPYYVWDVAERFAADVIEDFVAEYAAGRTPNPCLRCNERVKFAAVAERAAGLGFDAIATGHYARVAVRDGISRLHRAVDPEKDQSYVLAGLTQAQLAAALFPLGSSRKEEVRAEAAERGLLVADKPDSHDLCFIADGDTVGYLRQRLESTPGPIVTADGEEIGRHEGTWGFTVGQRRGLHLGRPADDGRPRYVLAIEPATATVTVGGREELAVGRIETGPVTWCSVPPALPADLSVQVRAHGRALPARVSGDVDGLVLELSEPEFGVAPGQAAALYLGDEVLGAAPIRGTARGGRPADRTVAGSTVHDSAVR